MLLAGLVLACLAATATAIEQLNITVPSSYKVGGNDAYVCAIVALPQEAHKLVGVIPLADMTVVHHILLYGEAQRLRGRTDDALEAHGCCDRSLRATSAVPCP